MTSLLIRTSFDQRVTELRIEFCKSRARAARFTEEVYLLREEMQRVIRFFQWKARFWLSKVSLDAWIGSPYYTGTVSAWAEGQVAYAHRQAAMYQKMSNHCLHLWNDLPAHLKRMNDYTKNPDTIAPEEFKGKTVNIGEEE